MFMLIEEKAGGARGTMSEVGWWGGGVGDVTESTNSTSAPSPALAPFPLEYAPSRLHLRRIAASFSFNWWIEWGSALLWFRWDREVGLLCETFPSHFNSRRRLTGLHTANNMENSLSND